MRGDPQIEFDEVPPGILALDCMVYFAKAKHKTFTRLLFAHIRQSVPLCTNQHNLPYARSCARYFELEIPHLMSVSSSQF